MLFNFLLSIASLKLGFHTFHISRSLFHLFEDDFYFLAWNPFRVESVLLYLDRRGLHPVGDGDSQ